MPSLISYTEGNRLTLLQNGAEFFPALEAAIDQASSHVYLESYIYADDETGKRIAAALVRAAQRGVATHLIIDGFGAQDYPASALEALRAAGVDALVYREYLDPDYLTAKTDPLVPSDSAEPPWEHRVPGTVIWARPGEQLHIHVRNGDPNDCHSLHVHGLHYGIESDGAWPRGVASRDGRRSDEILPGQSWSYVFDISDSMIGTWPFHDHVRDVQGNINRGLFGGLIVRDPRATRVDHEVPLFIHAMSQAGTGERFESGLLSTGNPFDHPFATAGVVADYICRIHGASMAGRVRVVAGVPEAVPHEIRIKDNRFDPPDVTVTAGTTVRWINDGANQHIVFAGGGGKQTFCLNGRAFVGNTPTIEGRVGETIRWYLFNLDVGSAWHNFHPHSARWQLPRLELYGQRRVRVRT